MKDLRLTLYDFLGYLIPGTILCLTIYCIFQNFNYNLITNFPIKSSSVIIGFIAFSISYMLGHLIHAISNFTLDLLPYGNYAPKEYFIYDFDKDFSLSQIESLALTMSKNLNIDLNNISDKKKFIKDNYWYCYTFIINKNENSLTQIFLNLNGFYRGISVGNFLSGLICIIISIFNCDYSLICLIGIVLIISSIIFYFRAIRFKRYLTKTVYTDFLSLNN
jgi:hypothetical protein